MVPGTGRFNTVWAKTGVGGRITLVKNVSAIKPLKILRDNDVCVFSK